MTRTDEISRALQEAEQALSRDDHDDALESLVEIREHGVTTKALEDAIAGLRQGRDISAVEAWIGAVRQRLDAGEDNPFRGLQNSGENFKRVPSTVGLSAIEEELLDSLSDAFEDGEDPENTDFALITNSEAESEGLSPGSLPEMEEDESESDEHERHGPLSDQQKTRLKSSLADRLRAKASGFEAKLSTKKAQAVSKESNSDEDSNHGDSNSEEAGPEPREVVSNQGAVEDFFADLIDEDEQEDEDIFELEDEADVESLMPDESSDFEDPFENLAEESNIRELTPMGPIDAVSRDASALTKEESEGESAAKSATDPKNPFADLMYLEDDEPEEPARKRDSSYESGVSQVRYRGVEPPPPTHRLKGGGHAVDEDSGDFVLDPPEAENDVDFDLGFTNPESSPPANPFGDLNVLEPEPEPADDDFDFDLGLSEPKAERAGGDAIETTPGASDDQNIKETNPGLEPRGDASQTKPQGERQQASREPHLTPLRLGGEPSEPIDEDEFFALAESFAVESSAADQSPYRGEPVVKERSSRSQISTPMPEPKDDRDNPFAHDAPTGVRHAAVESSFVLEEVEDKSKPSNSAASSQIATNMSGVLLEARRMYESGAFAEALALCQKIRSRGDNSEADELIQTIEGEMERVTIEEIGSLSRTPSLAVEMSDLAGMDLDHRSGFLISQIDGVMTFEDIIELSGMSRLETMEVLADMLRQDVIQID